MPTTPCGSPRTAVRVDSRGGTAAASPADELRATLGELEEESRRVTAAVATLLDA